MGGDFPEDRGEDEWHRLRREALRRNYLEVLLPVGKLLFGEQHYRAAADVCRRMIGPDACLKEADSIRLLSRAGSMARGPHGGAPTVLQARRPLKAGSKPGSSGVAL